MSTASDKALFEALGAILKEEREATTAELSAMRDALDERLASVDGASVLRSAASAVKTANLLSIRAYCDDILLRKSKHLGGNRPAIVRALTDGV